MVERQRYKLDAVGSSPTGSTMPIIYAIVGELTRSVKIGKTNGKSAEGRLKTLQIGSPDTLSILGEAPNRDSKEERKLHNCFSAYHLHGEWFDSRLTKHIENCLKEQTFTQFVEETLANYSEDPIKYGCFLWSVLDCKL